MISIPGFTLGAELYVSNNSIVYRARREHDGTPVIVKLLREDYPSPNRLAWFRHEYDITRSLVDVPGVVQVYGLEQHPAGWMLVLEDIGGDSLAHLGLAGQLDLAAFLRLAVSLTHILSNVHQRRIIHKDLNPANIIYNPTTDQICLIDFGLATRLSRETVPFRNASVLEGTLRYLAPEQTGRMNRPVDYRSDFYALGVTFYELLAGQVPFTSDDPMELVHSHIARPPVPPHALRPEIPEPLSAMILKLLAKDADERYQSAYGLQADLEYCLHQFETMGTIALFPIGQQDVSDRFALPQKLYGREFELMTLLETFTQVAQGGSALLLVAGAPGIGKTALVQELYRPLTERRGAFIAGKFDQVQRSVPYLAFAQAFRGLVRQLLTEPEAVLQQWREHLTAALGVNGQVIVEIIPDLELIIGPQPPVPTLGPQKSQNRFMLVFQHFLHVFTCPEHPLALFLDDLQWADSASLKLLEQILSSSDSGHLVVIGAYRDTEAPPGHPLWGTLETLRQAGIAPQMLTLGPLDDAAVTALVQDTLHVDAPIAQPLATLVQQKTGGNPFFLGEFLKALYVEELLTFDARQGQWVWKLAAIEARQMTDNVVTLLTEQVHRLPEGTQTALQRAACIGSCFDLRTVATVLAQPPAMTARHLEAALLAGLIEPLGENYKVVGLAEDELTHMVEAEYRFAHDRVQQAAYELVPEAERAAQHWQIGQLLLAATPEAVREERLFDLISQLNRGWALAATEAEQLELARLNLEAGKKAKTSAAYTLADEALRVGVASLPADSWKRHFALALDLHNEAAEAAYLSGDFAGMEQFAARVMQHTSALLDQVRICETRCLATIAKGKLREAVTIALDFVRRLGFNLPYKPTRASIVLAMAEARLSRMGKRIEDLVNLPMMTDPHKLAAMRLMTTVGNAIVMAMPEFAMIGAFRSIVLMLRYGNAPSAPYVYASYATLLCGVIGDIDAGYRFGRLALRLLEQFDARDMKSSVLLVFYTFVMHWKEHARNALAPLQEAYRAGIETGVLDYAGLSAYLYSTRLFLIGNELNEVEREMDTYGQLIAQLRQKASFAYKAIFHQTVLNLLGHSADPCRLVGDAYNEDHGLAAHIADSNVIGTYFVYYNKLVLCYLFQDYADARQQSHHAEHYLQPGIRAGYPMTLFYFYDALLWLALDAELSPQERTHMHARVARHQNKLRRWARHAPMNYLHKWHLVEAERCRVRGQMLEAREHYDQSIAGAREQGYVQEEALAYELAGRFYLARNHPDLSHFYLARAHALYRRWGALAKVRQLEERYPAIFTVSSGEGGYRPATGPTLHPTISSTARATALDIASIVKASQAISGEMQLESLLTRLLHILLENAGADRGALLLHRDGQWLVEADGTVGSDMTVLHSIPLDQATLPQSLISYVLRTQESIVLHDAPTDGDFIQDTYVRQQQPRSVLALPLLHQGSLTGLLYLENRLTSGAFTSDRQELLALLSGQVAISLENAHLYARLEELVEERTAQLATALSDAERARAVAEEANNLKTRFVANMSHELRTPLNAIINFTYIIKSGTRGPVTASQIEYLDRVYASGEHLLGLINDILDLAKIEAGRMELYKELINLQDLVKSTLSTAIGLTRGKPITLHHEIAEEVPAIEADKTRIRQVLLNLLSNAAKFTDEGSITVRVWQEGHTLITSVSDTGIGIPANKLDAIFEEFRQADEGSARSYQGTGLGLPICQRLIAMHGGRIWVESAVGVGSTFCFSLPIRVASVSDVTRRLTLPSTE